MSKEKIKWKCHTPNLFNEIMENKECDMLSKPLSILAQLLSLVGERASELNDRRLDELMIRLTIYSVADPESDDYDPEIVKEYLYPGDKL